MKPHLGARAFYGGAAWLRDCTRLGEGAQLRGRPHVRNKGVLTIGANFRLASVPVVSHLICGTAAQLEIGDDVAISHGAAISCSSRIRLGSGTRIGPFAVIADSDFHVVGDRYRSPEPRPIEIGRAVTLGARVNVLPGTTIGDGASIRAGSTVSGVVPENAVIGGVPARALQGGSQVAASEPTEEAVRKLVANTLGLASLPELAQGPEQLDAWDSLGTLRLLLALEERFAIQMTEREMLDARSVADLVAIVAGKS